jgi:hypothetical protein
MKFLHPLLKEVLPDKIIQKHHELCWIVEVMQSSFHRRICRGKCCKGIEIL